MKRGVVPVYKAMLYVSYQFLHNYFHDFIFSIYFYISHKRLVLLMFSENNSNDL